jgi:uncharacterized protein YjiS (DUF1127 family)
MDNTDPSSATPHMPAPHAPALASPRRLYDHLRGCLAAWRVRGRSRRLLAQLDDHMLRDIGIDPAQAWRETGKWFWQP